jgi:23S rRNA (guanosine2251-2'-O)-methyltransferase
VTAGNLAQVLAELAAAGFWIVGLDGAAERPLETVPAYPRCALVLGAEGRGLRRLTRERCDLVARLVIDPRIESLNVAVAAGIALYTLARRAAADG